MNSLTLDVNADGDTDDTDDTDDTGDTGEATFTYGRDSFGRTTREEI